MKRLLLLLALASVACGRPSVGVAPAPSELPTARAEIAPLFAEMLAAANAHDTDRHMQYYVRSPDLIFVVNNETIRGYDKLHEQQLAWWQNGKSDAVYGLVGDPVFSMPTPGTVIQTYTLSSRRSAAGASREGRINVTTIWQKIDGSWHIVYAREATA
jgi:ketosteroid isomerase-like protein